ncbi:MAG: type I-E CRISPR-associated protein Cse2/CasB [Acidobacteriota bacterium]|nr:type I-E CRISPR-associated protein Cse2/CasB [Acidobacteriota bacterium]
MADQLAIAKVLGRYATTKIGPLQREFCSSSNAAATRARAALARLRHLNSASGVYVIASGEELFEGWPEDELTAANASERDVFRAVGTMRGVLGLYAMHQQSGTVGCAVVREPGDTDEIFRRKKREGSFGRACRMINPNLDEASGVRRRLMALEAATDLNGIMTSVRGLVRLMKSAKARTSASREGDGNPSRQQAIQLDYHQLTQDIYLLQTSGALRSSVLTRWSKDYFSYVRPVANDKDEGSKAG